MSVRGYEATMNQQALPPVTFIACRACSAQIRLTAHAQSRYVACRACGKMDDTHSPTLSVLRHFKGKKAPSLVLPIGSRGKLRNTVYEVIGFTRWKEGSGDETYFWSEYVLFNPMYGYAFLSEYDGHWNYLTQVNEYPREHHHSAHSFDFNSRTFDLYLKSYATVVYAEGEFHWNVLEDEKLEMREYIAPPYVLIHQRKSDQVTWFKGEYIEPQKIVAAFNLKTSFPEKVGVGATQPLKMAFSFQSLLLISLIATALLLLVQISLLGIDKKQEVFNSSFSIGDSTATHAIVTPSFDIKGGYFDVSNLEFALYAPVENDWMEAGIVLMNDRTGEEYEFEVGVEYYSGYDGGQWTEGSQRTTSFLSAIPNGRYHMNMFAVSGRLDRTNTFSIQVLRDVPMWSNLMFAIFLLATFPAIQWFRESNFERRRWMNSDYVPDNA